jgi:hypothetical protein
MLDDEQRFDEIVVADIAEDELSVVIHRNVDGRIFLVHSPLGIDDLTCSVCASGVRVYLQVATG